MFLLEEKGLN